MNEGYLNRDVGLARKMQRLRVVCPTCRTVTHTEAVCLDVHPTVLVGPNWRAPRRSNDRAWARIATGDLLWDRRAVERTARKSPAIRRWLPALTKGRCSVCRLTSTIDRSGLIRPHGHRNRGNTLVPCSGTGQPPRAPRKVDPR